jgi:hypothetical protein
MAAKQRVHRRELLEERERADSAEGQVSLIPCRCEVLFEIDQGRKQRPCVQETMFPRSSGKRWKRGHDPRTCLCHA